MIARTDKDRTVYDSWKATTEEGQESMIETLIELYQIDMDASEGWVNDAESTSRNGCRKGKFLQDLEISSEFWTHRNESNA